ncbi:hypothetical protein [Carnobacterium maltaromaticum]|uniref:hypothetical protein n=1 Tax=Carnobacterium maltaromaticum TaxID=2751 RepID=UPI0012FB2C6A|nr:hypothetical protein [Carnobacterium maltaromaticum]
MEKSIISIFPILQSSLSELNKLLMEQNGLNELFIRLALMSQLFEKETKSLQSKKILCVYFPIFLSELTGSTSFLYYQNWGAKG